MERYIVQAIGDTLSMYRSRSPLGVTMNTSFPTVGTTADSMWQALDQLRDQFEQRVTARVTTRVGRGEVRSAVLALLAEQPMHGYQIIREIEERSAGRWKPSAGSVYPTLQLLADEGLVSAEESNGRKTYSLTEEGREVAEEVGDSVPWAAKPGAAKRGAEAAGDDDQNADTQHTSAHGRGFTALPKAGFELAQAAAQVGRTGTPEQQHQAVTVLDEARRRLYAILAQG